MRIIHRAVLTATVLVCANRLVAQGPQTQIAVDSTATHRTLAQRDVARMLVSNDIAMRSEGLRMAQEVRPENTSKDLRVAIVFALERESAAYQQRLLSTHGGGRGSAERARPVSAAHDRLITMAGTTRRG